MFKKLLAWLSPVKPYLNVAAHTVLAGALKQLADAHGQPQLGDVLALAVAGKGAAALMPHPTDGER